MMLVGSRLDPAAYQPNLTFSLPCCSLQINIKFAKTWTVFSNNVNITIRKYSSIAFIWVVTPYKKCRFVWQWRIYSRSFLGLVKFTFRSERVTVDSERIGDFRVVFPPLFQSESQCKAFQMEIASFHMQILVHLHANRTYFHMNLGFTLGLALKQSKRQIGSRLFTNAP